MFSVVFRCFGHLLAQGGGGGGGGGVGAGAGDHIEHVPEMFQQCQMASFAHATFWAPKAS